MIFESCHATWIFDTEAMRFRRMLKGVEADGHPVVTQWRPSTALNSMTTPSPSPFCSTRSTRSCSALGATRTTAHNAEAMSPRSCPSRIFKPCLDDRDSASTCVSDRPAVPSRANHPRPTM